MPKAVSSAVARAAQFAVVALLALNTLLGCWCGRSHGGGAAASSPSDAAAAPPLAQRGIATFGR